MTSVIRVYTEPSILSAVSVVVSDNIQSAYGLRFYFRGGKDVVSIMYSTPTSISVYIPSFSDISNQTVFDILLKQEGEIKQEFDTVKPPIGEMVLYDTHTKKILTDASFIRYTPFLNIGNAIFRIELPDGSMAKEVRYLSGTGSRTYTQFASLLVAKTDAIHSPTDWTSVGKMFLAYFVGKRHISSSDAIQNMHCLDSIEMILPLAVSYSSVHKLDGMNIGALSAIAENLWKTATVIMPAKNIQKDISITLSTLLRIGYSRVVAGFSEDYLEIDVDTNKSKYYTILIDVPANTAYISLIDGSNKYTAEDIAEELGIPTVVLVDKNVTV